MMTTNSKQPLKNAAVFTCFDKFITAFLRFSAISLMETIVLHLKML